MSNQKTKGTANEFDIFIGNRVREIRREKNFIQQEIADHLGISFQQVQKYENGKNRISAGNLYKLSKAIEVPLSEFFPK